ncbi:DUF6380 family protein [Streptomyces sp. NPDC088387]|uniref:DUF6380 family protein n=1 Tax=Streptomyces sp. NPDC088387 TaxID=3365859 RepID=UPI00381557CB
METLDPGDDTGEKRRATLRAGSASLTEQTRGVPARSTGPTQGRGPYRYEAPPRGRDQPQRCRTRTTAQASRAREGAR